MNLNTFSPFVRYAARSYLRAPFKIGRRIIFDYELIYLESGSFLLTVEDQEYICKSANIGLWRMKKSQALKCFVVF